MISRRYINEWKAFAPWTNDFQVEQDLVLSRSIVAIFSDEMLASNLAFRGGTALHKLIIKPQSRYSEDIDLVQINAGPIKEIIERLRNVLSFLGKPVIKQKANNNTLVYHFNAESSPDTSLKLKIEINCREHFTVLGYHYLPYEMQSGWFSGQCNITTYHHDEMLGTKLRALYQRRKGRDLYDLYKGLVCLPSNPDTIIRCYHEYMRFVVSHIPTRKEFQLNMSAKIKDQEFLGDMIAILSPEENYDPVIAYELVASKLIDNL